MKSRRNKNIAASSIIAAILGLAMLCATTASFGQQLPKTGVPINGNLLDQPLAPSDEFKKDPLFQEIQRMVLEGGNAFSGKNLPNGAVVELNPSAVKNEVSIESISDARWSAIETLLSAARTLQEVRAECIRQGDQVGEAKAQAIVRILRCQAMELMLAK
jgi:hypothetical protein